MIHKKITKLNSTQKLVTKFFYAFFKVLPILSKEFILAWERKRGKVCPEFYRLKKNKYFREEFKRELEKSNEFGLLHTLDDKQ